MPKLLILAQDGNRREIELTAKEVRLGRAPDSDVPLLDPDKGVSRTHAEFQRRGGSFFVVDLGSLNGTYVNHERVDETKLANGDEVQIGKFKLVFFGPGGE